MKTRIYLDTSVVSAYHDQRAPERMAQTREFWSRESDYEVSVSSLVREEIEQTSDSERRAEMLGLLSDARVEVISDEMRDLAQRYVDGGIFPPSMYSDALHAAVAVISRQDILVSWNFRHLVNRRKRAEIDLLNISIGLPTIEILPPSEL